MRFGTGLGFRIGASPLLFLVVAAHAAPDAPAPPPPAAPATAAPAIPAPPPPPPQPQPVTDPVAVGWEKACVVYRYSPENGKWSTSKSPRMVLPEKVITAVGGHTAAAIDPARQYSGWLFDLNAGRWTRIPPSPVAWDFGIMDSGTVAFVGRDLVVWGLADRPPHGAVLDTEAMQWRPMAKAPVPPRYRARHAIVGDKLCVWGGYGSTGPRRIGPLYDGAVYDVARDAWEKMPDPPAPGPAHGCAAAAWNGRMVLVGGPSRQGAQTGLLYDPAARAWEKLPDARFDLGSDPACVVSGDRLFVWSGFAPAGGGPALVGAVYDFRTRKWQNLPDAPIAPRILAFAAARGPDVIVWGGREPNEEESSLTDGAAYNLDTRAWRPIPPMPAPIPFELFPSGG